MNEFRKIIYYCGNFKWFLGLSMLLSGISAILLLVPYYSIYKLFYQLSSGQTFSMRFYGILAIVSIFLGIICYFVALWFSHLAGFRVERNMRLFGINKLLSMPFRFFDTTESGKTRKIIDDNAALTHSFVAHNIPDLVTTIVSPIVILAVIFKLDWIVGIICLALLVGSFYLMKLMMGNVDDMKFYMQSLDNMAAQAMEYIRGMQVVKIFNAKLATFKNFRKAISEYSDWALKYSFSARYPFIWNQLLMESLGIVLSLLAYAYLNQHPEINIQLINIMFCFIISSQLILFLTKVLYTGENVNLMLQAIDQLEGLFKQEEDEIAPTTSSLENPKITNFTIKVENLSFSYSSERKVLDGVTFSAPERQTTAIIGMSGSGKSTLARLITKMYTNYEGEITVGGISNHQLSEEQMMKWVTYVFQDTKLFKKSIKENLLIANPDATTAQLEKALYEMQCEDIIAKLPAGIETVIGSEGVFLSGGEQQRLALCRAYLKNAPILILDEVTASLDAENEFKIKQAIQRLVSNKTVIIIAHRLALIEHADQIIVLNKGRLAEIGTRQQLISKNGIYKHMVDSNNQSKKWTLKEE